VLLSGLLVIMLVAVRRGVKLLWTKRYIHRTIPSS
jgi:hypothetical protein